jgi:hypothetical protein
MVKQFSHHELKNAGHPWIHTWLNFHVQTIYYMYVGYDSDVHKERLYSTGKT